MFETQIWTAKILFFSEIPKYYWIFFSILAFFFISRPFYVSFSYKKHSSDKLRHSF